MAVVGWELVVMQGQFVVVGYLRLEDCCAQPVDRSLQVLMMGQKSLRDHSIEESLCLFQAKLFVVGGKPFGRMMGRWVKIVV